MSSLIRRSFAQRPGWLMPVAAALVPGLITVVLVEILFDAPLTNAIPYTDDEVAYYLQTAAFARAGFSGGYFTINEVPPAATFTRFGPHGPAFPVLFGTVGMLGGWRPYSIVLTGLACVIGAAAFACRRLRLRFGTAALALGSFWPLIIAIPSSMQESLHCAFALLAAPFVWHAIAAPSPPVWRSGLVVVLFSATLVRPTWGLVLIPVAWLTVTQSTGRRLAAVTLAVLFTAGAYAFMLWMAAPFPRSQMSQLVPTGGDWLAPLGTLASRAASNAGSVFRHKDPAEALWHAEALLLLGLSALYWFRNRRSADRRHATATAAASAFSALLMLCLLAAIAAFYEFGSWRAFRVLASPMLLILFVGLAAGAPWARWLVVAHLVCAPIYVRAFHDLHEPRFRADRTRITYLRRQVDSAMRFRPNASPWHNTVLVDVEAVEYALVGLPPGIGMTVVLDWNELRRPPNSAYLLLRRKDRDAVGSSMRLEPLAETVFGTLYGNAAVPELTAR